MATGFLRHSYADGILEPMSHLWRLNLLQIQTQIVHLVALDELYKTAYLDL
jgi:hypothetical protein